MFKTFPELRNDQIILREYQNNDILRYFKLMSDFNAVKFYRQPIAHINDVLTEFESDKKRRMQEEAIRWAITLIPHNDFIGTIDIYNIIKFKKMATLGCAILPEFQHQNIGYRSISMALEFMFYQCGLNRIQLYASPHNSPAIKTYTRLGFKQEGLLREYEFDGNNHHDMLLFSILKRDYIHY